MNGSTLFFGKVPGHGDFISYNTEVEFVNRWDNWIQSVIRDSQKALRSEWLSKYLSSPIYRFAISPGIVSQDSWIGTLAPSVDKVGRYYPFTLASKLPNSVFPISAIYDLDSWFKRAETLSATILDEELKREEIIQHLDSASLGSPGKISKTTRTGVQNYINSCEPITQIRQSYHIEFFNKSNQDLLHFTLQELFHAYSVFGTNGSEATQASLLLSQGLPHSSSSASFFDGLWGNWGWLDLDSRKNEEAASNMNDTSHTDEDK